ncbi:hypothetical protein BH11ARM2_BH11ARM2_35520 [soil metagenome]
MSIHACLDFVDVAYKVCSAFDRNSVVAVLVGGGAATFYAPQAYETKDLDFVLHLELFGLPDVSVLTGLGYRPSRTAGTYEHPQSPFTLEILQGPLAAGGETLYEWDTHRKARLVLHVIKAEDSVKDRLAHAIHNGDPNAAKQAAEVAKRHSVDMAEVRAWCEEEGGLSAYGVFAAFVAQTHE